MVYLLRERLLMVVFCRYLCVDGPAIVVNVDYRLYIMLCVTCIDCRSPEYPFPTPFNDCFDAYTWAVASASELGGDGSKIIAGGSSAGGNLVPPSLPPLSLSNSLIY